MHNDNTPSQTLEKAFQEAFVALGLVPDVLLAEATKPEFGDFQINGVMKAAKLQQVNPRELAERVMAAVKDNISAKLNIAGAGFINITLDDNYLAQYVNNLNAENKFGVAYLAHKPDKVVVDMSSPNLAKEMHVGHLRSTVIGDALARMFAYMGDSVIRQNHVGDWGTQFGMLIAYLDEMVLKEGGGKETLADLEKFYREAKAKFDADTVFADKARQFVVVLQNFKAISEKDYSFNGWESLSAEIKEQCQNNSLAFKIYEYWLSFKHVSLEHCQVIYQELNIPLKSSDTRGESFYNDKLTGIVDTLTAAGVLSESDGAKCVFFAPGDLPGGEEAPLIIQKKDGGFLYATTDLAAMEYRANAIEFTTKESGGISRLGANRIVYVVDSRQSLHFRQLFVVAKKAGLITDDLKLEHAAFGTMMNEDGQPFKTRSGEVVKLIDLISEAKLRAHNIVASRNPTWSEDDKTNLANILAIGAIKYSDLSKNRSSDYIFSFDKMLAFDCNTAPYLLYAYTRIQSVIKKTFDANLMLNDSKRWIPDQVRDDNIGVIASEAWQSKSITIKEPAEHKLALHLAKFADMLAVASAECYPHYVTQYLYTLAGLFMQFYETCPILKAEDATQQQSRLALADLTAKILKTGLEELLGIAVIDRM